MTQMNKARNSLMNIKTSKCKIKTVDAERQKISILRPSALFALSCQFQYTHLCDNTGINTVFCLRLQRCSSTGLDKTGADTA